MPTPSLRILIADNQHWRCLSIEKFLNQRGYYCIAPLLCFEELMVIISNAIDPFDLIVVNSVLLNDAGLKVDDFLIRCNKIRHVLIYEDKPINPNKIADEFDFSKLPNLSSVLSDESIKVVFDLVDPPMRKNSHPTLLCGFI